MKLGRANLLSGRRRKRGSALVQTGDVLAGVVVVAQQTAAVGIALQSQIEQHREDLALIGIHAHGRGKLGEELHPCVDVGGTVVAVHHGHRRACRGSDHVDFLVDTQLVIHHHHGKVGGTGRHIAGLDPDGVGRNHAGTGITLGGNHGDTRLQDAGGIQEGSTLCRQDTGIIAGA